MKDQWANLECASEQAYTEGCLEVRSSPHVFTLGLTNKCNLGCIMCFSRDQPQIDMSSEVIEKLKPYLAHSTSIHWNDAGEIFASSRTPEFMQLMSEIRPPRSMLSTNFLLADRWLEQLFDSGVTNLAISIDAATAETYQSIRRRGSWSRLMLNLEQFVSTRQSLGRKLPTLSFIFVSMNHNVHEIPAFVDMAHHFSAEIVQILRMLTTPDILMLTDQPDPSIERHFFQEGVRRARTLGIRLDHTWLTSSLPEDENVDGGQSKTKRDSGEGACPPVDRPYPLLMSKRQSVSGFSTAPCPAPWREMLIQYDGMVRPCCYSNRILGDLNRQSVEEVWNGREYREFRRKMLTSQHADCIGCPILTRQYQQPGDPISEELHGMSVAVGQDTTFEEHELKWQEFKAAARSLRTRGWKDSGISSRLRHFRQTLAAVTRDMLHLPGLLRRQWLKNRDERTKLMTLISVMAERVRHAEENVRLLVEAVQRPQLQIASVTKTDLFQVKPASTTLPPDLRLNGLFFSFIWLSHLTPEVLTPGQRLIVPITLMNTSTVTWPTTGLPAVFVSYAWRDTNGAIVIHEGLRTQFPQPAIPIVELSIDAELETPAIPGEYILSWDLVYETVAWFRHRGCETLDVPVRISSLS